MYWAWFDFCSECGAMIPPNATYCPRCRMPLEVPCNCGG